MSWRIPCNATEGRFYNGGKVCSKCEICPGGQGRDMSKRVLNTSETHGDLECIECEVCPPKTYNNGGREGCNKCLDDCAVRNRHDCPEKATRLCGECLDGYFEDYQIDDNPSTCIPCTEKEKTIIPACANLTTPAPSAINTTHLSSKATTYLYVENRAITKDNHVFRENIPVQNKAVESNNENLPTQNGIWFLSLLGLCTIITVLVVFLTIWVICRYYKKRRQRLSGTDQGNRTGVPADTSGNSFNSSLLAGASGNYIDGPLIAGTSANSFHSQIQAGTSGNSADSQLLAGTYGNIVYNPILSDNSGNGPLLPCNFRNPVDIPLLEGTSEVLVGFPLPDGASRISGDSPLLDGSNRSIDNGP
ncbi:hypothetical protein CHS0354_002110 [Potamilus streckersoni]|uniref:Uncharacterized protein n=1 Tax=Potamilus streckersoni TaxID=2493646 RepID=A0AAE0TIZ3_9BIVA|nr:hypothetical protein CHS0354_002110 [Potamilus streckersoni]